jgi:parallel beta-helix repeat protein
MRRDAGMRTEKKLERARRKADKANRRLGAIEDRSRTAAPTRPPKRVRRRRRGVVRFLAGFGAVLLLMGAGAAAWFLGLEERIRPDKAENSSAATSIEDVRGVGTAVVIRDGEIDFEGLATALIAANVDGVVTMDGKIATVTTPIVVDVGGTLDIRGTEVRLVSNASTVAMIEVRGGHLGVHNSTITSWDDAIDAADKTTKDGRASVLVTGGGSTTVDGSALLALGYEESDRHGFSLTGGSTSGTISDTRIDGSQAGITVSGNVDVTIENVDVRDTQFAGIELAGTTGVSVTDTSVQGSEGDGIVVLGTSSDVVLRGNDIFGNAGTGLSLLGSGGEISVSGNYSHRNERAGVTVSNTRDAHVTDNKVWGNGVGVSLVGGNSGTLVQGNEIGGNRGAGVESTSAGNTALVHDNVIDHNEHGVVIADGTVEVRSNTISDNTWGVAVLDKSPRAVIRDNTITNSADGAIRFVKHDGIEIKGNTLNVNRMAPFIVDVANDSLTFQEQNDIQSGRKGTEWVYEPLRDIGELADLTPVPAEFFTQPNVQFLLPEEQVRE